ncbi:hypothetical protein YC2023_040022 [Brassica napus]
MEMSHRGKEFLSIIQKAESHLRRLLDIPPEYSLVSSKAAPPPSSPPSLSISANPTTPSITSSTDLGQKVQGRLTQSEGSVYPLAVKAPNVTNRTFRLSRSVWNTLVLYDL